MTTKPRAGELDLKRLFAVPPAERNLSRLLESRASTRPDHPLLVMGDRSWSYREIDAWVSRYASGLRRLGVGPGDKVLIMLPNCPEFLVVWFACARLGAVEVPTNTAYKGMLLHYIVANSDAKVAVVAADLADRFDLDASAFAQLEHLLIWSEDGRTTIDPEADDRIGSLSDLDVDVDGPFEEVAHTDLLAILYSSGTTGPSKGILLSHNYFWYGGSRTAEHGDISGDDRLYTCLPLFHANAQLITVMTALVKGATVVLDARFSASMFWSRIRASKATRFTYIGGMIPILMKQEPCEDDRDHAAVSAVGAAAPADQIEEFQERFGVQLIECYGQTENCAALANPVDAVRIGSVGQPNCGYEVQLVDEHDEPVAVGEVGELVFRPQFPHIMMDGYYKMAEATLAASRNLWFHTGDLLRRDADNYYYYVDRKKDAIRRRGENISAFEVEMVVNTHPSILESAAIAAPSDVGEDEVMVVVTLKEGRELDPLDLIKHCESRMPYFAVPRFVDVRTDLPKTPTHRVEKYRLREEVAVGRAWDREKSGYKLAR